MEIAEAIASDGALLAEARRVLPALRTTARLAGGPNAVRRAMALYFQVYPQPERTDAEWSAWWFPYERILSDLPEPSLVAAMLAWSRKPDSRFMPSPGELLDLARHIVTPEGRAYSRARAAATLADSAIRDNAGAPFRLTPPALREMKTAESKAWVAEQAAAFKAQSQERERIARETAAAKMRPTHGALAPGRHVTPEMVALMERRGTPLAPVADRFESEIL